MKKRVEAVIPEGNRLAGDQRPHLHLRERGYYLVFFPEPIQTQGLRNDRLVTGPGENALMHVRYVLMETAALPHFSPFNSRFEL